MFLFLPVLEVRGWINFGARLKCDRQSIFPGSLNAGKRLQKSVDNFCAFSARSTKSGQVKKCYRLQKMKPHTPFQFKSRKINISSEALDIFGQYQCSFAATAS